MVGVFSGYSVSICPLSEISGHRSSGGVTRRPRLKMKKKKKKRRRTRRTRRIRRLADERQAKRRRGRFRKWAMPLPYEERARTASPDQRPAAMDQPSAAPAPAAPAMRGKRSRRRVRPGLPGYRCHQRQSAVAALSLSPSLAMATRVWCLLACCTPRSLRILPLPEKSVGSGPSGPRSSSPSNSSERPCCENGTLPL